MPNRILREGILTSPRIAKLGWPEEVFYRRLHSVVDDFGRYYGDIGMLRAACYPRQLNKVSDSDVGKWLRACVDAALVRVYQVDGEDYIALLDFNQQVRAKKSKFPDMPSTCAADATQTQSNAHLDGSVSEVVSEGEKRAAARDPLQPDDVEDQVWADWKALRAKKRTTVSVTAVNDARKEAEKAGISLNRFFVIWCRRGSQGLEAAWLTPQERAEAASSQQWHETWTGIEARGVELGLGKWDQTKEQSPQYRARVMAAHQQGAH
jgi:hypothetical protein